jgi:ABC-type polysaccharide/polyol phosphate export permease
MTPNLPVYDSAQRGLPLVEELRDLVRYRDLLAQLIARNIKVRYKRSVLGVLWTMINPLMMTIILTLVFSELFRFTVPLYAIYVLSGTLLWSFFSQVTTAAMSELVWGGTLLNRIYMPRSVFAATALGTGLVNLALALPPLLLVMWFMGAPFKAALLSLPFAVLLTALFAFGLSLLLSALAIYFADVFEMYQLLLVAWQFLTPIIYPIEIISEQNRWLFKLNPLYYFVEIFRLPIHRGVWPDASTYATAALIALVTLALGWSIFTSKTDQFAYRV